MVNRTKGSLNWLARAALAACALIVVGLATPATAKTAQPIDELRCLAQTIYFEARGEPELGQLAVAHVVMNRAADPRFPNSICGVVRQGGDRHRFACQFTWWCDGQSDRPRDLTGWYDALLTAVAVYCGNTPDPTDGALWYHATYVSPSWREHLVRLVTISQHVFYGEAQRVAMRD